MTVATFRYAMITGILICVSREMHGNFLKFKIKLSQQKESMTKHDIAGLAIISEIHHTCSTTKNSTDGEAIVRRTHCTFSKFKI